MPAGPPLCTRARGAYEQAYRPHPLRRGHRPRPGPALLERPRDDGHDAITVPVLLADREPDSGAEGIRRARQVGAQVASARDHLARRGGLGADLPWPADTGPQGAAGQVGAEGGLAEGRAGVEAQPRAVGAAGAAGGASAALSGRERGGEVVASGAIRGMAYRDALHSPLRHLAREPREPAGCEQLQRMRRPPAGASMSPRRECARSARQPAGGSAAVPGVRVGTMEPVVKPVPPKPAETEDWSIGPGVGFWRRRLPQVTPASAGPPTQAAAPSHPPAGPPRSTAAPPRACALCGRPEHGSVACELAPSWPPRLAIDPRDYAACWSRPITGRAVASEAAIIEGLEDLPADARRRVLAYAIGRWPLD